MGNRQGMVKQIISITSIFFCLYNVSLALAVPDPPSDTWVNLSPTTPLLISSQSSSAYDPINDAIYQLGGHPIGGSFPQTPELFKYDILTNKWSVIRPVTDQPWANDVSTGNVYDEGNSRFIKLGMSLATYGQYLRNQYLTHGTDGMSNLGDIQYFEPSTRKWTFFYNSFNHPVVGNPLPSAYDRKNQVIWNLARQSQGFYAYDTTLNLWTQRLGWGNTPDGCPAVVAYDYHQNKIAYYCDDPSSSSTRKTYIYDPVSNRWTDKTPSPIPDEYSYIGGKWAQGNYPPRAYGGEGGNYTVTWGSAVYDSINKKVLFFIPVEIPPVWGKTWSGQNKTTYDTKEATIPTTPNGFTYVATTGGVKGSSEPSWPTTIGNTVSDGTITWTCKYYQGTDTRVRIEVWAYDTSNDTWEHKANLTGVNKAKRGGDLQAVYSRKDNLTFVNLLCRDSTASGYPVCNQYYAYRYATATPPLGIPENVSISLAAIPSATISWDAVSGASGYNIYRASGSPTTPWALSYSKLNGRLITRTSYTDSNISNRNNYFYYVKAVDSGRNEGDPSIVVRTQPYLVIDGYVSVNSSSSQRISWTAVRNAISYNVYRAQATVTAYPADWTKTVTTGWTQYRGNIYYRSIYADNKNTAGSPTDVVDVTTSTTLTKKLSLSELSSPNTYYHPSDWHTLYVNVGQSPIRDTIRYSWAKFEGNSSDASYTAQTVKTIVPGIFTKLNASPIIGLYYDDTANLTGGSADYPYKVYVYRVTAVNTLGVEGGASPHWPTIPSAPWHLNWKETWVGGTPGSGTVKLKWTANPESGIKGYNIYRQWGDYTIQKIGRLVNGTTFTDTLPYGSASMGQMGYYVSAIDALDQEGIPCSRALVNRTDKSTFDSYGFLNDYYSGIDMGVINSGATQPRIPVGPRTQSP